MATKLLSWVILYSMGGSRSGATWLTATANSRQYFLSFVRYGHTMYGFPWAVVANFIWSQGTPRFFSMALTSRRPMSVP